MHLTFFVELRMEIGQAICRILQL